MNISFILTSVTCELTGQIKEGLRHALFAPMHPQQPAHVHRRPLSMLGTRTLGYSARCQLIMNGIRRVAFYFGSVIRELSGPSVLNKRLYVGFTNLDNLHCLGNKVKKKINKTSDQWQVIRLEQHKLKHSILNTLHQFKTARLRQIDRDNKMVQFYTKQLVCRHCSSNQNTIVQLTMHWYNPKRNLQEFSHFLYISIDSVVFEISIHL